MCLSKTEEHASEQNRGAPSWMNWILVTIGYHDERSPKESDTSSDRHYWSDCFWTIYSAVINSITLLLNFLFIPVAYVITAFRSILASLYYTVIQAGNLLFIVLLLIVLGATGFLIYFKWKSSSRQYTSVTSRLQVSKQRTRTYQSTLHHHYGWFVKAAAWIIIAAALLSIPWEFIRLYQKEQAKRAALVYAGLPPDCDPYKLTVWQTIKTSFLWHFSWTDHNHCEKYYHAVLVDPLWEVTPMVVLSSALARCVLHPLEMISNSLGRSVKLFFSQIPSQWQPIFIVVILLSFLTILLMTCRYRIKMPMFLLIEPRTPTGNSVQCRRKYIKKVPSYNQVTEEENDHLIAEKPKQRNRKQRVEKM
ncbi:uncharacterized protein LOC135471616 isoform X2 [Liolophura sinensis]|uniref:uncharacterized protein LOC135471616 isoform X2 n=1 Tax=Liolophura sinensis TaxID=3198878 RepID=UPI003158240F